MNPRVWTGIAIPMAVVSVLMLVIAVGSAWYIRNVQRSVADMLAVNLTSVRAAQELELCVRDLRTQAVRYFITANPKALEPIPRMRERTMAALKTADEYAYTPAEQVLITRARIGLKTFFAKYEGLTQDYRDRAEFAKTLEDVDSVLTQEVLEPTREYMRMNEGMLARANDENQRMSVWLTSGFVVLGLCGSLGGLLAGWVIASSMRRNVLQTEERLRLTARRLDDAAGPLEHMANRAGRSVDALDAVAHGVSTVLDRLKQSQGDALRAEQLAWAGQMAAGIAHEIRNPLMALKLLVQALAEGRTGDRLRPRDLQVFEEEIGRLEQSLCSFLDFARPPRPHKVPVEVGPLIEQVVDRVRGRAERQGVAIEVVLGRQPVRAELDPNQLQQVLYNLLFNAIEAQPGGGQVKAVLDGRADGSAFILRVEDDGPGLPAQLQDRVFEPFVSTKDAGMGLGLSICRRIVEDHGGEIRAANRAERGASFTVWLPLARAGSRPDLGPTPTAALSSTVEVPHAHAAPGR